MKAKIIISLLIYTPMIYAQNNPIFSGGIADGISSNQYAASYYAITYGGNGDGSSINNYNQIYILPSSQGGIGDGTAVNNYNQYNTQAYIVGGSGDGSSNAFISQGYNEYRIGGVGDGYANIVLELGPLPIELLSFKGVNTLKGNLLEWELNGMKSGDICILERSTNSRAFEVIYTEEIKDIYKNKYDFLDTKFKLGDNYYRLKILKNDGSFKYSSIILIRNNGGNTLTAYPNPFNTELVITCDNSIELSNAIVKVYNIAGQILAVPYRISDDKILINTQLLPPAPYTVEIKWDNQIHFIKVVKIN